MEEIKLLNKIFNDKKFSESYYIETTKLFFDLGIEGQEHVNNYIGFFIKHSYAEMRQKSDVYLSTGFSRSLVDKFLKEDKPTLRSNTKNYYKSLISELKRLSEKSTDGLIPINGKNSFSTAFHKTKTSHNIISSLSMLESLVTAGFIEKIDGKIKFLTTFQKIGLNSVDDTKQVYCKTISRLCNTLRHNLKTDSNDERMFQMSYSSNNILPKNYKNATDEIRESIRNCFQEVNEIIEKWEEKDEFSKEYAQSLNHEIGLSAFVFDNDL